MEIKYWKSNNLGDLYNIYLSLKLNTNMISTEIIHIKNKEESKNTTNNGIYMCGSVLRYAEPKSYVMGVGLKSEAEDNKQIDSKYVFIVRGELTKNKLGLKNNIMIGDPGLILNKLVKFDKMNINKKYDIGILPHYNHAKFFANKKFNGNIKVISMSFNRDKYDEIIRQKNKEEIIKIFEEKFKEIYSCKIILSSSLHGLIFGHAFNINSYWFKINGEKNEPEFKYEDYYTFFDEDKDKNIGPIVIDKNTDLTKLNLNNIYSPNIDKYSSKIINLDNYLRTLLSSLK